nr:hypothetical protein Itr_chr06CG22050 [Ipomoea trifida]
MATAPKHLKATSRNHILTCGIVHELFPNKPRGSRSQPRFKIIDITLKHLHATSGLLEAAPSTAVAPKNISLINGWLQSQPRPNMIRMPF